MLCGVEIGQPARFESGICWLGAGAAGACCYRRLQTCYCIARVVRVGPATMMPGRQPGPWAVRSGCPPACGRLRTADSAPPAVCSPLEFPSSEHTPESQPSVSFRGRGEHDRNFAGQASTMRHLLGQLARSALSHRCSSNYSKPRDTAGGSWPCQETCVSEIDQNRAEWRSCFSTARTLDMLLGRLP